MDKRQNDFSLLERLIVVGILLSTAAITIQTVLRSVKTSEGRTVHSAVVEYSALRNTYAEQSDTARSSTIRADTTSAVISDSAPIK